MRKEIVFKYCPECGFETFHNKGKCLTHNNQTEEDKELLHIEMHKS